ncbi:MAG: hypothetical protein ABW186_01810 [Rhodanobacteraceae bacterium]
MTLAKARPLACFLFFAATSASATPHGGGIVYSFEAPDYTIGELDGQQGWTTDFTGFWAIDDANPYAGGQHLRSTVTSDGFAAAVFGPTITGVGGSAYAVASAEIAVSNSGTGESTYFSPSKSDGAGGAAPITRVEIRPDGSMRALQPGFVWADTTGSITDSNYHAVKVVADNGGAGTIEICLDGRSIFSGLNMSAANGGTSYIDTIWLMSSMDIGSTGSTSDFDEMRIADSETGGCSAADAGAWTFDGIVAPALPTGWSSDAAGAGVAWATESSVADTAPNAAQTPDHGAAGEANLVSAQATVAANGAELTFRHRWNAGAGHGGVLEISIDGGAFADIVDAGGTFVEGGYNGALGAAGPLGARDAWTGTEAIFVTTAITLPPAAARHDVRFRWRFASDATPAAAGDNGWWVDSVTLADIPLPTTPSASIGPTSLEFSLDPGATASDTLVLANVGGGTLNFSLANGIGGDAARHTDPAPHRPVISVLSRSSGMADGLRGRALARGAGAGIDLAQMTDNAPVAQNGVSCGQPGVMTSPTSWWRRFYFNEHADVAASTAINSVTVTSETGPVMPVTINLYTVPHDATVDTIPVSRLTPIGTGGGMVGGELTATVVPVSASVADTVGNDLVVEYHVDGSENGSFYPGGNATPQTHATFLSSDDCGTPAPVDAASLGSPDFHLIMLVNVSRATVPAACATPADVPWLSASPSSGSIAGGASRDITVNVDADGIVATDETALLCLTTNDANAPLIEVPVHLVVGDGADAIFGDGFDGP